MSQEEQLQQDKVKPELSLEIIEKLRMEQKLLFGVLSGLVDRKSTRLNSSH